MQNAGREWDSLWHSGSKADQIHARRHGGLCTEGISIQDVRPIALQHATEEQLETTGEFRISHSEFRKTTGEFRKTPGELRKTTKCENCGWLL